MKRIISRSFSLALAFAILLTLAPAARADGEGGGAAATVVPVISSVEDILIRPKSKDGHLRFGESGDVMALSFRGDDKIEHEADSIVSVEDALEEALQRELRKQGVTSGAGLDYISYFDVKGTQGTIYDGYNAEGDTGAGVAGVNRYFYRNGWNITTNYRIAAIRFVPKTSFSGQALISYFGYYHYADVDENNHAVVRQASYSGRIYITVREQEPGIAYSTDGEPVRFSSADFATYSQATNGRSFKYISFRLPRKSEGTLYYNYIDDSIYDYAIEQAARFYRNDTPSVDRVFFVPAEDYEGEVYLEFNGVDTAGKTVSGEMVIKVTNHGPDHNQPRAEGPFAYKVYAGRPVSLDPEDFTTETYKQRSSAFSYFSFASLPSADQGRLYDDSRSGADHDVRVGVNYTEPAKIRFLANANYSGVVSVPIVITPASGESFDSMLRFIVLEGEDAPLRYTVEPERRVNFIASDFSDACYAATGYDVARVHFDTLPPSSTGSVYYDNDPVTTRTQDSYYKNQLDNVGFLANAGFTGETTLSFTAYAYGYSSSNGRAFHGTVTIVSTSTVAEPSPIGGSGTTLTYYTSGPAVPLNVNDLRNAASASLPGTPETLTLERPGDEAGRLCLDFYSLSRYTEFSPSKTYPLADASRISFLPKAGFSGTCRISFTVRDASGNSFGGNIQFVVTPPTSSSYFTDMNAFAWAIPAVDFFRYYSVTTGSSYTNFGPSADMRRADFLLLLSRAFSFPGAGTKSFADVDESMYYAGAVASAKSLGIVTGGAKDKFNPESPISREDAALYLYRALKRAGTIAPGSAADLSRFPDASNVSSQAVEAMGALVREGVFQGYVVSLLPKRTLSRAEAITILYRALT